MKKEVVNAALAGLMHDIGKFAQRAEVGLTEAWDKSAEQDYGYQHALASYGFLRDHVPDAWKPGLSGVAYHHKPKSQQDYWIQLADWLSSSERESDEDNRIPRMQSIFCSLAGFSKPQYLPLRALNPADRSSIFPEEVSTKGWTSETRDQYARLWREFEESCKLRQLKKIADQQIYLENFLSLLQDFTWCIPSSFWQSVPDISLYDHSRTTAAIAACLAADDRSIEWCQQAKASNWEICFIVGADLSGVQTFIYSLASSGAAKSLRARSFYVQLLSEAIAQFVLDQLGLPISNLLYVGGGGFQLLAPISAEPALQKLAEILSNRLLMLHGGALGLTIQWMKLTYQDFQAFNQARDRLGKNLNQAKKQPFSAASSSILQEAIGKPISFGGNPEAFCHITGEDGPNLQIDSDGTYKSSFVISLEELGRQLPRATAILIIDRAESDIAPATSWQDALKAFRMDAEILMDESVLDRDHYHGKQVRIWRFSPLTSSTFTDAQLLVIPPIQRVVSYRPFARQVPLDANGLPLTFDELAQPMRGHFSRWGVLRMDVDNLGRLFQTGFGEKASLSRTASLSFAFRIFFEGWLPHLVKPQAGDAIAQADLSRYIYIQYSGGDDLFVVGAWDALPEFARRVRSSLAQYACGNPAITLSAGMAIADKGFPLYQAARQAGEAEEQAKAFRRPGAGHREKDAFTFLETPMDWQTLADIQEQAYTLADSIQSGRIKHSLLQTILSLDAQIRHANRQGKKFRFGPWAWMAAYQLSRVAEAARNQQEKELVMMIREKFINPDETTAALGLAARWAQFLTRGG